MHPRNPDRPIQPTKGGDAAVGKCEVVSKKTSYNFGEHAVVTPKSTQAYGVGAVSFLKRRGVRRRGCARGQPKSLSQLNRVH